LKKLVLTSKTFKTHYVAAKTSGFTQNV